MCHGAAATGGVGPNLIQSSLVRHDEGGDQIGPVVLKGRSERGMPAFPMLTAGDISDLAAFLHKLIDYRQCRIVERAGRRQFAQESFDRERGRGQAIFLWSREAVPTVIPRPGISPESPAGILQQSSKGESLTLPAKP